LFIRPSQITKKAQKSTYSSHISPLLKFNLGNNLTNRVEILREMSGQTCTRTRVFTNPSSTRTSNISKISEGAKMLDRYLAQK
jgi:hypothetical protein